MTGLDNLLAKSLDSVVRENLGEKSVKRIEDRLFEKYGMTITQALNEFHKVDGVLREFFGAGADGLERQFLESVCSLERSKNKNYEWIKIEDQYLAKLILESFGDEEKKKIMNALTDESRVISEILKICELPQTSGYRKINSLIKNGLLIVDGNTITKDGKKVNKYRTLFSNVKIDIIKSRIIVRAQLTKEFVDKSTVLQVIEAA